MLIWSQVQKGEATPCQVLQRQSVPFSPCAQAGLVWVAVCTGAQLRGMLHCALGLASMTSAVLFSYTCKIKHLCKCLENQVYFFGGLFTPVVVGRTGIMCDGSCCSHCSNSISTKGCLGHCRGGLGGLWCRYQLCPALGQLFS